VFGRRSGAHAADVVRNMHTPEASRAKLDDEATAIDAILARAGGGRRVSEIKADLGSLMDKYVAVFRDEAGLQIALDGVRSLKEEAQNVSIDDKGTVFNQDVLGALELQFMLDNAECIVISALERRESRGAQFRTDYPSRNDDEWLKHINVSANGSEPEISYSEVTMTQWEPQERTY
jgi:succinate dehydrogenase / fumarate reductase flavoprotein subunit